MSTPPLQKHNSCPHCGSIKQASSPRMNHRVAIYCLGCGAYGPESPDVKTAWEAWDSRAEVKK